MDLTETRVNGETALQRYGRPDMPSQTKRDAYKVALVDRWMGADLDYLIALSFSEDAYSRNGLRRPDRMVGFVKERLEAAGYWGPYVLVVHDRGTGYWHPHLIIKDNGIAKRVERELFRFGDLGKRFNGPIESAGAFAYHAERATEQWPDVDNCEFRPRWIRRPRPRGHGASPAPRARRSSSNPRWQPSRRCSRGDTATGRAPRQRTD